MGVINSFVDVIKFAAGRKLFSEEVIKFPVDGKVFAAGIIKFAADILVIDVDVLVFAAEEHIFLERCVHLNVH